MLSDIRTGLPGGGDERDGGDAAVAFLFAAATRTRPVLAEPIASASATASSSSAGACPASAASRQWEERFGEHVYVPLAEAAITEALKQAGVTAPALAPLIVAGPHGRATKRAAAAPGREADGARRRSHRHRRQHRHRARRRSCWPTRSTAPQADELIAVVVAGRRRRRDALAHDRRRSRRGVQRAPVAKQIAGGSAASRYTTFLTWRGFLKREPPRRPDPEAPAAPPSLRAEAWKFGFTGSRCQACGARHVPPRASA